MTREEDPGQPIRRDVRLRDGRTLRMYDTGGDGSTVVWHHGSPQTGIPPAPLVAAAAARGLRLLSYGRPSYGGSSPDPGRTVASAAADVAQLADAAGRVPLRRHGRVRRRAARARLRGAARRPRHGRGLPGRRRALHRGLRLVRGHGRAGRACGRRAPAAPRGHATPRRTTFDENSFTPADYAALAGDWESLGADAGRAGAAGPDGLIDDDVAFAADWGFAVTAIDAPVLIVHGGEDRVVPVAHGEWLARRCPRSELWLRPHDGHVSILHACPLALDWLTAHGDAALSPLHRRSTGARPPRCRLRRIDHPAFDRPGAQDQEVRSCAPSIPHSPRSSVPSRSRRPRPTPGRSTPSSPTPPAATASTRPRRSRTVIPDAAGGYDATAGRPRPVVPDAAGGYDDAAHAPPVLGVAPRAGEPEASADGLPWEVLAAGLLGGTLVLSATGVLAAGRRRAPRARTVA